MRYLGVLLLVASVFANGDFVWEDGGVPVRQGVHIEWQRTGDVGGDGEVIFAWSDTRTGDRDVYMQKIDTLGNELWGDTGIRATVALGRQEDPVLVSDGNGGAFLAWIDYRDDEYGDVYAQHIDSEGNLSWDPAGVPIAVNTGSQQSANMARGAAGVAYLIWLDGSLSESGDIFGTVLQLSGPLAAGGTDGLPLVTAANSQFSTSIETSGDDAVVVWVDQRISEDPNIYGQRLDVNFTGLWGVDGIPVCDVTGDQSYPKVAPADGDRVAVSWVDTREDNQGDIYAQVLDVDGAAQWTAGGVSVGTGSAKQEYSRVKSNGVDRIYVVWEDYRNDAVDQDLYMQAFDMNGNALWTDNGNTVSAYAMKQLQPRVTISADGGIYVTWLDQRNGGIPESDIYIQYMTPDGTPAFEADGLALTSGLKNQFGALVRSDGDHGAMVVWADIAVGSVGLTGQHVYNDGTIHWDENGREFFFGIDGDASKITVLPWADDQVAFFWEDLRWAQIGAVTMGQRMDALGNTYQATDGSVLFQNPQQITPYVVPDENGGAYISATNTSTGSELIYVQHVDGDMMYTWDSLGIPISENFSLGQIQGRMVADSDGNVIYFWTEEVFLQGQFLLGQKFDTEGNAQWTDGGESIVDSGFEGDVVAMDAFNVGEGNVILLWKNETPVGNAIVYLSRVNASGEVVWTTALSESSPSQQSAVGLHDTENDVLYIAWKDTRNFATSGVDLYLQSIDYDGNLGTESVISEAAGNQTEVALTLADDGSGVVYAAWQDFDGFQHDIFVRNLTTGTDAEQITDLDVENKLPAIRAVTGDRYLVAWEDSRPGLYTDLYFYDSESGSGANVANGVAASTALLNQMMPQIIPFPDSSPEAFKYLIVWQDMRSSGKTELRNIYAQAYLKYPVSTTPEPQLVKDFKLEAAYPNPFNGAVTIPFENPQGMELALRIYDVRGRLQYETQLTQHGSGEFVWNGMNLAGNVLESGVYLLSVQGGVQQFTQKLMYLK